MSVIVRKFFFRRRFISCKTVFLCRYNFFISQSFFSRRFFTRRIFSVKRNACKICAVFYRNFRLVNRTGNIIFSRRIFHDYFIVGNFIRKVKIRFFLKNNVFRRKLFFQKVKLRVVFRNFRFSISAHNFVICRLKAFFHRP